MFFSRWILPLGISLPLIATATFVSLRLTMHGFSISLGR